MTTIPLLRGATKRVGTLLAVLALFAGLAVANATSDRTASAATTAGSSHAGFLGSRALQAESAQSTLYATMRLLWEQHMEWTYDTVTAFAANPAALTPTLDRLLQNQVDLGNAIVPYYGRAAGNQLTALLKTHILDYVPILKDAQAGDQAALSQAISVVLANGTQIGNFLGRANPNWSAASMRQMMRVHNQQTLVYATDILKGNWAAAVTDYDAAEAHMVQMADMLSRGIIAQFPQKFSH